jgi:glycosyltransferase involved in cell wall biosynthesis
VRFIGAVGPAERSSLLGGAHALLHLIGFEEPFGYSVVEAMACGTPVIAFRRGSMPELIADGTTGFLVDEIEGAVAAVGRSQALDRAVIRAEAVARFGIGRMVEAYIAVYEEVARDGV